MALVLLKKRNALNNNSKTELDRERQYGVGGKLYSYGYELKAVSEIS